MLPKNVEKRDPYYYDFSYNPIGKHLMHSKSNLCICNNEWREICIKRFFLQSKKNFAFKVPKMVNQRGIGYQRSSSGCKSET